MLRVAQGTVLMAIPVRELVLIYEPEEACIKRLQAEGYDDRHALEISSYLAQSTDLAAEFDEIAAACNRRGLSFRPVELDQTPTLLAGVDPAHSLMWTLTDGIAYFRGGAAPALARLYGLRTIGSDDTLFALCQDKFRSGAVLRALGLPAPEAGLVRDGRWITLPPASPSGYFVKPNRLGAKVGIWEDFSLRFIGRLRGPQPASLCRVSRRRHRTALRAGTECARKLFGRHA